MWEALIQTEQGGLGSTEIKRKENRFCFGGGDKAGFYFINKSFAQILVHLLLHSPRQLLVRICPLLMSQR